MQENKILFSFTSYEIINSNDEIVKYRTAQKKKIEFNDLLKDCNIGLSGNVKKIYYKRKMQVPKFKKQKKILFYENDFLRIYICTVLIFLLCNGES